MPFWLPQGTVLLRLIEAEVREQLDAARLRGDQDPPGARRASSGTARGTGTTTRRTCTSRRPRSGRAPSDDREYALKPMNCPGACLVFASGRHSYRELPLRLAEFGLVSRYEREGVLHGLLRVRAFTQDDAHVYCTLDQVTGEVDSICAGDRRALRALRLRRGAGRALDPAGEVDRHRRAVAARGGGPARGPGAPGPRVRGRARGRGPSTGRRSTSTSPTPSAAPGSAAPASSTSRCRSASTSPTPAPTTPSTPR